MIAGREADFACVLKRYDEYVDEVRKWGQKHDYQAFIALASFYQWRLMRLLHTRRN
jgi:hypothetical protein